MNSAPDKTLAGHFVEFIRSAEGQRFFEAADLFRPSLKKEHGW